MLLSPKNACRCAAVAALIWSLHPPGVLAQESPDTPQVINAPRVILGGVPFTLELQGDAGAALAYEVRDAQGTVLGSGSVGADRTASVSGLVVSTRSGLPLAVRLGGVSEELSRPFAPGWFSLAPPVVAILLALVFKEVIAALLAGVWLGALAVAGYNPLFAVWRTIDLYAVAAIADVDGGHTQIIVFSLLLGRPRGDRLEKRRHAGYRRCCKPLREHEPTRQDRHVDRRPGHIFRRLRQHLDRREHDAADHGPPQDLT